MIAQPASKICRLALAITVAGILSACASHSVETSDQRVERPVENRQVLSGPRIGSKAAAVALRQVGVPYRYGGNSTSGFDCSGLVQYAYRVAGMDVPRTTAQLWSATNSVRRKDLQEGDLLFFNIEGKMSHVGIYLGNRRFVHAPSSGRRVTVENLDSAYYESAFIRGGRPK